MRRLVSLLGFLALSWGGLAADAIRLSSGEFPPFTGEKLFHGGMVTDVVDKVFTRAGIATQYGYFPWARSMAMARDGEWDGSIFWLKTPEREKDFYFSQQPLYSGHYAVYFLKSLASRPQTVRDLLSLRVGVTLGYTYGAEFEALRKEGKVTVDESGSELTNFQKLLAGRIDVFLIGALAGPALLRQSFTAEEAARLDSVPHFIADQSGYLILSRAIPENKARMVLFDQAFRSFVDSGDYSHVMEDFAKGAYGH